MTIWERIAAALATIGLTIPVAANVLIVASEVERPDTYIVYLLVSSPPEMFADNLEKMRSYRVQVSVYSRSGLVGLPDVTAAMVAAGFIPGVQRELPYNPGTRHYGLALEFVFVE